MQAKSKPNITRMYSHIWLHPNKPPKGMDATKQASGPKDHYATNPYRENKQEHVKRLELSKQARFQNKEHMEKSQTMHRHAQRKQSKPFIET